MSFINNIQHNGLLREYSNALAELTTRIHNLSDEDFQSLLETYLKSSSNFLLSAYQGDISKSSMYLKSCEDACKLEAFFLMFILPVFRESQPVIHLQPNLSRLRENHQCFLTLLLSDCNYYKRFELAEKISTFSIYNDNSVLMQ